MGLSDQDIIFPYFKAMFCPDDDSKGKGTDNWYLMGFFYFLKIDFREIGREKKGKRRGEESLIVKVKIVVV